MTVNESMSVLGILCNVCIYDYSLSGRGKRKKKGENCANFLPGLPSGLSNGERVRNKHVMDVWKMTKSNDE